MGGALDRAIAVKRRRPRRGPAPRRPRRPLGYAPSIVGRGHRRPAPADPSPLLGDPAWPWAWPTRSCSSPTAWSSARAAWSGCAWSPSPVWAAMTAAQLATNHGWPVLLAVARRRALRPAHRGRHRPADHPARRPLRRPCHPHLRPVDGQPGLQPQPLPHQGLGVTLNPPKFVHTEQGFHLLRPGGVLHHRGCSSSTCDGLRPAWPSPASGPASRPSKTLGVSVLQMKVIIAALGAFVAGVGGACWPCSSRPRPCRPTSPRCSASSGWPFW